MAPGRAETRLSSCLVNLGIGGREGKQDPGHEKDFCLFGTRQQPGGTSAGPSSAAGDDSTDRDDVCSWFEAARRDVAKRGRDHGRRGCPVRWTEFQVAAMWHRALVGKTSLIGAMLGRSAGETGGDDGHQECAPVPHAYARGRGCQGTLLLSDTPWAGRGRTRGPGPRGGGDLRPGHRLADLLVFVGRFTRT